MLLASSALGCHVLASVILIGLGPCPNPGATRHIGDNCSLAFVVVLGIAVLRGAILLNQACRPDAPLVAALHRAKYTLPETLLCH